MKNIKDEVFELLADTFGADHVTDVYPKDWATLPAVQYTEEENKTVEHDFVDDTPQECKSYVRYCVDIWDARSTSLHAVNADAALTGYGLVRTSCKDVADPSGLKHKQMRFEGIVDCLSDRLYWPEMNAI